MTGSEVKLTIIRFVAWRNNYIWLIQHVNGNSLKEKF